MRKVLGVLAVAALLAMPAVASAYTTWTESFDTGGSVSAVAPWGSGKDAAYDSGTNQWEIVNNYAYVNPRSVTISGVATNLFCTHGTYGDAGPGNVAGLPANYPTVLNKSVDGPGTYTWDYYGQRNRVVFGYQDPSNFFYVRLGQSGYQNAVTGNPFNTTYGGGVTGAFLVGYVNGVAYPIAHFYPQDSLGNNYTTEPTASDHFQLTLVWDTTNNTVDMTYTLTDTGDTGYTGNVYTASLNGISLNRSDAVKWTEGRMGFQQYRYSDQFYEEATYTVLVPEPATMAMLVIGGIGVLARRRNGK